MVEGKKLTSNIATPRKSVVLLSLARVHAVSPLSQPQMASTSSSAPVTARVKRYRALYTQQVTQKTKRWHDGELVSCLQRFCFSFRAPRPLPPRIQD